MRVIVDFCLIPLEAGLSLSPYIAECQKIIGGLGLKHELHAYGTNIEGEWDVVMGAVKQCHVKVHDMGAPRITSSLKIATRTDKSQTMEEKIGSVESLLRG